MSELVDLNKPKHQQAQDWAQQVHEQLHWMQGETRKIFLNDVLEFALTELSDVDVAIAFGDLWAVQKILNEAKELYEEDA